MSAFAFGEKIAISPAIEVKQLQAENRARETQSQPGMIKTQSAREFGEKLAEIFPIIPGAPLATTPRDWAAVGGVGGAALGAGLGGLLGLVNPGEDEQGKRKSRLMAALKGALGGGALGGGVGAGVGYFSPETVNRILQSAANTFVPIGMLPTDKEDRRNVYNARGRFEGVNMAGNKPVPPITFNGKPAE